MRLTCGLFVVRGMIGSCRLQTNQIFTIGNWIFQNISASPEVTKTSTLNINNSTFSKQHQTDDTVVYLSPDIAHNTHRYLTQT